MTTAGLNPRELAEDRLVRLFEAFDLAIQPSQDEANALFAHLRSLTKALAEDGLSLHRTGSYARSTAIRRYSDLDVLAVKKASGSLKHAPEEMLRHLEASLRRDGLLVSRSSTTLSVDFGKGALIDLTPAIPLGPASAKRHGYLVPSQRGDGWTEYFPEEHDSLVLASVERLGVRFTALVRMLKWWSNNSYHAWPSYVVESLVAQVFSDGLPSYPNAMEMFLRSEAVVASADLLSHKALTTAQGLARAAVAADLSSPGALLYASKLWKEVFGDEFPDLAA